MFCFVALIVFGILGIFSAANRQLAKEAADCVFRHITLRPCNTSFQDRARGKILNWLLARSPFVAKIFNKYFQVLSWIFFVLMAGSFAYTVYGGYNFYVYGSCNGLNSSAFCVFDPTGGNNKITAPDGRCLVKAPEETDLDISEFNPVDFPQKNVGAKNKVIFMGCYSCDFTREAYPIIKNLLSKYDAEFTFVHFPVKADTKYLVKYDYCVSKEEPQKYWEWVDSLFASSKEQVVYSGHADSILRGLGMDEGKIKACIMQPETEVATERLMAEIEATGIYGTPTIFINGKPFVGPKPERVYKRAFVK